MNVFIHVSLTLPYAGAGGVSVPSRATTSRKQQAEKWPWSRQFTSCAIGQAWAPYQLDLRNPRFAVITTGLSLSLEISFFVP